jgi:putative transposase
LVQGRSRKKRRRGDWREPKNSAKGQEARDRYCLSFSGWKERQALARELKAIYRAETAEAAAKRLSEFEAGPWDKKISDDRECWRRNWQQIIPFCGYPPEVRGHFPSDEAATKLIFPALRKIAKSGENPPLTWRMAANQFAERFNKWG